MVQSNAKIDKQMAQSSAQIDTLTIFSRFFLKARSRGRLCANA